MWIQFIKFILGIISICLFLSGCNLTGSNLSSINLSNNPDNSVVPDSILQNLEGYHTEEEKVEYLLTICELNSTSLPDFALILADLAKEIAKELNFNFGYARALYWKAFILNQENPENIDLQNILADVKICIELFEKTNTPIWLARALNLRALIHYNLYEESKGISFNKKALQIIESISFSKEKYAKDWGDIYRTAGNIELYTSENTDSVLYYFDQSRQYYFLIKDSSNIARLLTNIAITYEARKELSLADSSFQQSINLYQAIGNENHIVNAKLGYATFLANRFKETRDKKWFDNSNQWLAATLALKPRNVSEIYFQYGANFQNLSIYLNDKNNSLLDSASYYYEKVLSLAVKEKNTKYIAKVSEEIARICPKIESAKCRNLLLQASGSYQAIVDSTKNALKEASDKMEEFKEKEARLKQRQIIIWSILSIISLIILFIVLFLRSRIKHLNSQLALRLESLRSQMNPHFISNSLNAIDSLINQNRNEEASEYIIDFSRLCRLILSNSKKDLISLKKELETLGYYLSLEKLRMRKKLTYKFDIDESINQDEILVPPMILQPFIENSIVHGIQKKQAPGHILISIQNKHEDFIECIIEDDGIGRKKAEAFKTQSVVDQPSWGISITRERIESIKKIKSTKIKIIDLIDKKKQAIGTRVIIRIPIINKLKPKANESNYR